MEERLVELTRPEPGLALLTFNRPDKLNALSTPLLTEFMGHLEALERDDDVRVLILTGAGERAFVAGADISEYAGQSREAFVTFQLNGRRVNDRLEAFPKPTLAAVNGYALGGGFELALCCDVMVVSTSARLGLPEGLLGLSPGGGGTQRLLRTVGRSVAADVLLSARRLSGRRAYELGLAAEVAEPSDLMRVAFDKARYMLKVAPLAAREIKSLLRLGADAALATGLTLEQEVLFRLFETSDAAEGIRAFTEKRSPAFEGRVAVLTGAAAGIGRACAQALARAGAHVVVSDIDDRGGEETVEAICGAGGVACYQHADVTKMQEVARLMETATVRFGRLDILVNNAAVALAGSVTDIAEETWSRVLDTNLTGVWRGMKCAVPHMIGSGGGSVVNISSMQGSLGFKGWSAYAAAKGGIDALTRQAAVDYAPHDIRVNAVAPGTIMTPMNERIFRAAEDPRALIEGWNDLHALGRFGQPTEVASAVVFLAGEASSFVTGHILPVDGGMGVKGG